MPISRFLELRRRDVEIVTRPFCASNPELSEAYSVVSSGQTCSANGDDHAYLVPFVEDEHTVFLNTIIPSRKATEKYLREESDDEA